MFDLLKNIFKILFKKKPSKRTTVRKNNNNTLKTADRNKLTYQKTIVEDKSSESVSEISKKALNDSDVIEDTNENDDVYKISENHKCYEDLNKASDSKLENVSNDSIDDYLPTKEKDYVEKVSFASSDVTSINSSKDSEQTDNKEKVYQKNVNEIIDNTSQGNFENQKNKVDVIEDSGIVDESDLFNGDGKDNEESFDDSVIHNLDNIIEENPIDLQKEQQIENDNQDSIENYEGVEEKEHTESQNDEEIIIENAIISKKELEKVKKPIERIQIDTSNLNVEYHSIDMKKNDFDSTINQLINKISANQLIGIDLLQIAENDAYKKRIHEQAIKYLNYNYQKSNANLFEGRGEIVISLVLIALEHYDRNFWDNVYDEYESLYRGKSEQKVNSVIRRILDYYSDGENRQINYVIRHAITPVHYIPDFIEFAFDIYEGTFKCELIHDQGIMNEILTNIFVDVSSRYENSNNIIKSNAKTYKLIKTTKDIIDNVVWFSELIEYTKIILKYIDSYYWNESKENLPYFTFFSPFFEEWAKKNNIYLTERSHHRHESIQWTATYSLSATNVILHIPNHLIKKEYLADTIKIVISNGDDVIKIVDRPTIREVVGGLLISSFDVTLNNPIGEIEYKIYSEDTILFDSKKKLWRSYIIFSENNKEIKKESRYVGNVSIVGKDIKLIKNIDIYYVSEQYSIGSLVLKEYESIMLDDKAIYLSYTDEKKIIGDRITEAFIKTEMHRYDIYRSVSEVIFVSSEESNKLQVRINNDRHRLNDINKTNVNDKTLYHVVLKDFIVYGFNYIEIKNLDSSNVLYKAILFYCPEYNQKFTLIEDDIKVNVNCSLIGCGEVYADFDKECLFELPFKSNYFEKQFYLIPKINIPIYKIDDGKWNLFKNEISIKDINLYSKVWVDGINFSKAEIVLPNNKLSSSFNLSVKEEKHYIPGAMLKNLEGMDSIVYSTLRFYNEELIVASLNVYYRAMIDAKSVYINYESDKGASISFNYFGKDRIIVNLLKDEKCVYEQVVEGKPANIEIKDINTFTSYKLRILGGTNDLFSLGSSQYSMYEKEISFYDIGDIVDHTFKIEICRGEIYSRAQEDWIEKRLNVRNTTITICQLMKNGKYDALIVYKHNAVVLKKKVELLITTEVVSGKFWGSITFEDDLLLYDYKILSIVFNENKSCKKNMDILEYRFSYDE